MSADTPDSKDSIKQENLRLKRAVEELSILNEISTTISSTMELGTIETLIIKKCIKHFHVEQAAVMILREEASDNPFQTMIREADQSRVAAPYRLDTQLTGWMLKHRQPLLVNDLQTDERFQAMPRDGVQVKSLLCVPLFKKGKMMGLISCFNKKGDEGFSEEDQRLLSIIAAQSAQVIENARLLEQEQMLTRIQEEHRLAAEIQTRLLPKAAPSINGYDIAGVSYPAKAVGGDYFDFISIDEHRLAFCVADVCGKGIPAALLMSNLQATIRTEALLVQCPCECLNHSNRLLYRNTEANKFATLFYGILDVNEHSIVYANAGHNRPFIVRGNGEHTELCTAGIVLSMLEQFDYPEDTCTLAPGEVLVVYSDGVTEAINELQEEYGEERLWNLAKRLRVKKADDIVDEVIKEIGLFAGTQEQFDDITLMVIKRM
ncbi:SpoIIE family protein phosphatase [bacterium]|nr:SpoIIE family protein phosphatase [bacterium]